MLARPATMTSIHVDLGRQWRGGQNQALLLVQGLRERGHVADLMAVLKGVRHGIEGYRQLGGVRREQRGAARRYQDDEHLFI